MIALSTLVAESASLSDAFAGLIPELLRDLMFSRWDGAWLQRDLFRGFCVATSIALSFFGAGLLLLERRARRVGQPVPERIAKRIGIAFTVVGFLVYFDFFNPNTRYVHYYHRHELYHYYLGSKYFEEVGYHRLYTCTAIAEVELGRGAKIRKKDIRDLSAKNLITRTTDTYIFDDPDQCKRHFTNERWEAFRQDVKWFERSSRGDYWDRMLQDHGYNPPPVWTMAGKFFGSFAPAGDTFFKALTLIDVSLQLGAVLMLGWAFGWRTMALATVFWGCNAPAGFYWTGGAFMRQDWIFLVVSSLCLARKRKFVLSGGALTWASLLRVFPVALFGGAMLIMLFRWWKTRRIARDHLRFVGGCVLALALLLPSSMAVTGAKAYGDFAAHISLHKGTPLTNHMGLETMLVHDWGGRMVFTRDDRLDDPFEQWKDGRAERRRKTRPLFLLINAFMLAWLAWAVHRTRQLWIGLALGAPIIISLSNLTCYYYSVFLCGAVLAKARPALAPAYLALAGASQVLLGRFYWIDDKYTAQSYLFWGFGACMLYAYSRPFRLGSLLEWLRPGSKRAMLRSS